MTDPLVCGVMLTADRPAMTARAIQCFHEQTYPNKILLVLDSGREKLNLRSGIQQIYATVENGPTHGELCNLANGMTEGADIIAHFDSDDWSHPERLTEQVKLLQKCRGEGWADCVGFNDMLFWDSTRQQAWQFSHGGRKYSVGASHCYYRLAWEKVKFKPMVRGADTFWLHDVPCYGVTSAQVQGPLMICEIHGGNVSSRIVDGHEQWKRVPEWDNYCIERMRL